MNSVIVTATTTLQDWKDCKIAEEGFEWLRVLLLTYRDFKELPTSIRLFDKQGLEKFVKNNDVEQEALNVYKKTYSDKVYYYIANDDVNKIDNRMFKSFAFSVKHDTRRLSKNSLIKIIKKQDDIMLYVAGNSPTCLRVGLADDWQDNDMSFFTWIKKASLTDNF